MLNRILLALGWFFVALAFAGVALPLVPATPFVILAAICFARSSPAAFRKLAQSPVLGPILHDWHQHRGMRPAAKLGLMAAVVIIAAITFMFGQRGGLMQIAAVASVVITAMVLVVIRTIPNH